MVKRLNEVCEITLIYKKNFPNVRTLSKFHKKFEVYLEKDLKKKIWSVQTKPGEKQKSLHTLWRFEKDRVDFLIRGFNTKDKAIKRDRLLNKIFSFVDVNVGIKKIHVSFSKTIKVDKSPYLKLINDNALIDFNVGLKFTFNPSGIMLQSESTLDGRNARLTIMLANIGSEKLIDITTESDFAEKDRWDIVQKSIEMVNNLKRDLLSSLKVKEK